MTLKAQCGIAFPRIADFIDVIVDALDAHDMRVERQAQGFVAVSPFGTARLTPGDERLDLVIEAVDGINLNRVRYSLTGLIQFNAKSERLAIEWTGDTAGDTLPPDLRILTVREVFDVTPRMRRVSFAGEDLFRFASPHQLHARLLFQPRGTFAPEWPRLDDRGSIVWPGGRQRIGSRVYTIRSVDAGAGVLAIDFVLHESTSGPGIEWVRSARHGDVVGILGPAAHGPKPADHHLLVGDETGLPGIARILETLPEAAVGAALIEVNDPGERQSLAGPPGVAVHWLYRDGSPAGTARLLEHAVEAMPPLATDSFVWVGCEFHAFRAIRAILKARGFPASRQVCFPHWRRGMSEEDIVDVGGAAVAG
ncbi:siderophore-interacting protein [Jiella sonneratiae]|uniref:Siderophore-interacting protein n=1 Tax=Jiella sonneratiae TaxID=2816856 RepID=A0ABS3J6H0_9HYPH|nr:siderophore-interacting protein [Jiella sonneratiae]MBO0904702.1 siderophore-interacting protein [Jiella sonneratiae]